MPRIARAVIPGVPHHVTQRGDRREEVFLDDADRSRYLELLKQYAVPHGLAVLAYCLMPNHVHLVVVPRDEGSLVATLKPVHLRYAQHLNRRHRMAGRRWQGRYYSCPMDDAHTMEAIRYVERNPVRARMVTRAERYRWSSAAAHAGLREDTTLTGDAREWVCADDWSAWLAERDEGSTVERLRLCTRTGRPFGDESFTKRLEKLTGRILHPLPGGRPRKPPARKRKHG